MANSSRIMLRLIETLVIVANFASFVLKIPFVIQMSRLIVEVRSASHLKSLQSTITTLEPPYATYEGLYHPNDTEVFATSPTLDIVTKSSKIEMLSFAILFIVVLFVHLNMAWLFAWSKDVIHHYYALCLYFATLGFWLFIMIMSFFVDTWQRPFSLVFLCLKLFVHGSDWYEPDVTLGILLFRWSIVTDLCTYILTFICCMSLANATRTGRYCPNCMNNWKRHYNLSHLL